MQMGFLQIDVIAALDAANGDPIIAAEYLLGVTLNILFCLNLIIREWKDSKKRNRWVKQEMLVLGYHNNYKP